MGISRGRPPSSEGAVGVGSERGSKESSPLPKAGRRLLSEAAVVIKCVPQKMRLQNAVVSSQCEYDQELSSLWSDRELKGDLRPQEYGQKRTSAAGFSDVAAFRSRPRG